MNNIKHTPGPWKATLGLVQGPENQTLALVAQTTTSAEANARLIAEAPAMLEALKGIRAALGQNATFPADVAAARSFADQILARIEGSKQ